MFAFLIDRSPSTNDNLETFVGYIVKRKLADAFMRMKFDKVRFLTELNFIIEVLLGKLEIIIHTWAIIVEPNN